MSAPIASPVTAVAGAPVGVDSFLQPRRAAFWLLMFFLANGLYYTVKLFATDAGAVPTTVYAGLAAWTLYTIPILLFFRALDLFEQHPPPGHVLAFAWGGLGAVYLAVPANNAIIGLCAKLGSPEFAAAWAPAIAGPTTEESLKLMGVILLIMVARTQFRTLLSVLIAGALAGLGFQVVEDLFYSVSTSLNHSSPDQVGPVIQMFIVRGLLCGLWSHTAYTTVASFGVGYFVVRRDKPLAQRLAVAVAAFITAWFLHFFWNSPVLLDAPFMQSGLFILYFPIKGIPILLAFLLVWRVADREHDDLLENLAQHYIPEDLITPEERRALGSIHVRRQQRKAIRRQAGRAAAKQLAKLQKAQLRLTMRRGEGARGTETEDLETLIRLYRSRLQAAQVAGS